MRRIVIATSVVAVLASAASSFAAGTASTRHVARTYTMATTATTQNGQAQGSGLVIDGGPVSGTYGLIFVKLRPTDREASIRLTDRTGRTVQALVQQTARDGSVTQLGIVCGRSSHPLRLAPGAGDLVVRPSYGTCGTQPSVPTSGTVAVHFTG